MRASELRTLGWALLGTTLLLAAASGYTYRTFDAYVHLFFADHYLRGWFTLWEPRWYGGFSATTYPPLTHQLLALLTLLLRQHERAFVVLMATAITGVALATARFAARLAPLQRRDEVFAWALLLAALSPTIPRFAYVYGQLPTLTATPLVLTAMLALDRYLRTGDKLALAAFTALIGAVGGAHHISVLFAAIGSAVVGLRALIEDRARLMRTAAATVCAALVLVSVIWPFLKYATAAAQTEIPHASRLPIWKRAIDIEVLELGFLLLFSAFFMWKSKDRVFAGGLLFLSLLSAGGTTPLPDLLFRGQSRWLTYDKFHVWASALTLGAIANIWPRPSPRALQAVIALLVPMSVWSVSHKDASKMQPPFVRDISGPLAVLNSEGAERYRHLTLGFGDQSVRFDILGKSPNIDGDYHTARNHPLLRASGISTLDTAKYYDAGPSVLKAILAEADQHSLRWVLVFDDWYYRFLFEAGFELKDIHENGVSVFEKADVPSIPPDTRAPDSWAARLVWGVLPLLYLCSGLLLALLVARKERRDQHG